MSRRGLAPLAMVPTPSSWSARCLISLLAGIGHPVASQFSPGSLNRVGYLNLTPAVGIGLTHAMVRSRATLTIVNALNCLIFRRHPHADVPDFSPIRPNRTTPRSRHVAAGDRYYR